MRLAMRLVAALTWSAAGECCASICEIAGGLTTPRLSCRPADVMRTTRAAQLGSEALVQNVAKGVMIYIICSRHSAACDLR